jgi:hypothetical protein
MLLHDTISTICMMLIIKDKKMIMITHHVRIWKVTTKSKACLTTVQALGLCIKSMRYFVQSVGMCHRMGTSEHSKELWFP